MIMIMKIEELLCHHSCGNSNARMAPTALRADEALINEHEENEMCRSIQDHSMTAPGLRPSARINLRGGSKIA